MNRPRSRKRPSSPHPRDGASETYGARMLRPGSRRVNHSESSGEDGHGADRALEPLELRRRRSRRRSPGPARRGGPASTRRLLDVVDRDDRDALLVRPRRRCRGPAAGTAGFCSTRVDEATGQRRDQHRADQRRAQRGAEVLRGPLQAARLVGLGRVDRRHDHVAQLGQQQPGADAEQRQRDRELGLVELDVDRRRAAAPTRRRAPARPACATRFGREARGELRAGQRRDEHRHRHREQALAGLERVEAEHDLQVDGQDEERAQQDQLLHHQRRQARAQRLDPQQRAVEQRVAALALAPLLPDRERGQAAEARRG